MDLKVSWDELIKVYMPLIDAGLMVESLHLLRECNANSDDLLDLWTKIEQSKRAIFELVIRYESEELMEHAEQTVDQ